MPRGLGVDAQQVAVAVRSPLLYFVALYLALFILRPWERLFPSLADYHPERLYAAVMIAAVVLFRADRIRVDRAAFMATTFFATVVISAVTAYSPVVAWDHVYKYLTLLLFFAVLMTAVRDEGDIIFLFSSYLLAMGAYLSKALWEYFVHGAHQYTMGVRRLVGIDITYGHPNDVAGSILLSLPVLGLFWSQRSLIREYCPSLIRWLISPMLGAYAAVAVTALFLTRSRSGVTGLLLVLAAAALVRRGVLRKVSALAAIALVVVATWVVLPEDMRDRLSTLWNADAGPASAKESAESRWVGFIVGVTIFKAHPVFGVGPGNFIPYRIGEIDGVKLDPHNLIGQLLAELGICGTASFVALTICTLYDCRTARIAARRVESGAFLAGASRAIAMVVVLLMFAGFSGHNLYRFNWLWMCAFAALVREFASTLSAEKVRVASTGAPSGGPRRLPARASGSEPLPASIGAATMPRVVTPREPEES